MTETQNPIDAGFGSSPNNAAPSNPASNPIDAGFTSSSASTPSLPSNSAPPSAPANPIDAGFGGAPQTTPDDEGIGDSIARRYSSIWNDPKAGVGGKLWRSLNEPLIDSQRIENWTGGVDRDANGSIIGSGWTSTAGLHAGASEVAAGFTSPLSLLLLLGGPAGKALGLFEGAGESLLTRGLAAGGAGMDAATAKNVVAASQWINKYAKSGLIGESGAKLALAAAENAGVDINAAKAGLSLLTQEGFSGTAAGQALEKAGTVHTIVSNIARNFGGLANAEKLASGVQAAVDAGFGVQMITGAAMAIPRVSDSFKAYSDYTEAADKARANGEDPTRFENQANLALEEAKRLMVAGGINAAFGVAGLNGAWHEAGSLIPEAAARVGLRFKPQEENVQIKRAVDTHMAEKVTAQQGAKVDAEELTKRYAARDDYPGEDPSKASDFHDEVKLVDRLVRAGGDVEELERLHDTVEQAAGRATPPVNLASLAPSPAFTDEGLAGMDVDLRSLTKEMGVSLYGKEAHFVAPKELLQNAMDAVRGVPNPEVTTKFDDHDRTFTITDNGKGLTKGELGGVFLDLASSGKRDSAGTTGGFGVAKASYLLTGADINVRTVTTENGEKVAYRFTATPEEILSKKVSIEKFVPGHDEPTGTQITYKAKEPAKADGYRPYFSWRQSQEFVNDVARYSPNLPGRITQYDSYGDVMQGASARARLAPVGTFDVPGGKADVSVSDEKSPNPRSAVPVHISNQGMHQLVYDIYLPQSVPNLPTEVQIDLKPGVVPGHEDYPFQMNREGLLDRTTRAIRQIIQKEIAEPLINTFQNLAQETYKNLWNPESSLPIAEGSPSIAVHAEGEDVRLSPAEKLDDLVRSLRGEKTLKPETAPNPNAQTPFREGVQTDAARIPIYDSGARMTPEERTEIFGNPKFQALARQIRDTAVYLHNLIPNIAEKDSYNNTDRALDGVGIIFSDKVHGAVFPNPADPTKRATLMINPFTFSPEDAPGNVIGLQMHVIMHELVHREINGHNEDFTTALANLHHHLSFDAMMKIGQAFKEFYDRDGRLDPDIAELGRKAQEIVRRPVRTADVLGGNRLAQDLPGGGSGGRPESVSNSAPEPARVSAPRSGTEMSPERKAQLLSQKKIAANYTPEEIDDLLHSLDPSRVTQWHQDMAKELGDHLGDSLTFANQNGALAAGVKNYLTQLWQQDEKPNQAANGLNYSASNDGNFTVNTSMARRRIFQNLEEGLLYGKKLRDFSPIDLTMNNRLRFAEIVSARKLVDTLRAGGIRMADGRPVVAMSGDARHVEGEDGSNPATFVDPNRTRSIGIAPNLLKAMDASGELRRRVEEGSIVSQNGPRIPQSVIQRMDPAALKSLVDSGAVAKFNGLPDANQPVYARRIFAWNPGDYVNADHPAFRDWMQMATDSRGYDVLLKSNMLLHPDIANYVTKRLGIEDRGPETPFTNTVKAVSAASREAKGLVLGLSPFHLGQEGLRGIMTGISPINEGRWDARNDGNAFATIQNGLEVGRDYGKMREFEEGQRAGVMAGNSKLISKIPGLNKLQSGFHQFLFDYIDNLKVRAAKNLFERYAEQHAERVGMDPKRVIDPDLADRSPAEATVRDKAAEDAATETNERFGGLNYKRMGRDMNLQQVASIAALAPDWLESELRFTARLFGDEGSIARADVAKTAAGLWGVARVLNYLTSGSAHLEAPFGVAVKDDKGKEKIYSIRTLPTDMMHMVSDPGHFLAGRVAPLARAGVQTFTGRDEFGRRLPANHIATNILEQVSPIALQSAVKTATGAPTPPTNTVDQFLKAGGLSIQPFRTQAEKVAGEIASDHTESGPVDPAQLRKHQMKLEWEDRLRAGTMKPQELNDAVHEGQLRQDEASKIFKDVKATEGMEPSLARLYLRTSRMPAGELLRVWDEASQSERQMLTEKSVVQKAAKRYFSKALKEMTETERREDPIYNRLRSMNLRPF